MQLEKRQNQECQILDSWSKNTTPWTNAVRQGQIESRQLVTNQAIIEAVTSCSPDSVLDLGCGEGWLTRALTNAGIDTIGVDAIPDLISQAQTYEQGNYQVLAYEQISEQITAGQLNIQVEAVVCNFSLFGQTSVENLFASIPYLLKPNGWLIVQTLHPLIACGDVAYQDGWREGTWSGFSQEFTDPAPWYFRTLQSWINLFVNNNFQLIQIREPIHPYTCKPASIIFIARTIDHIPEQKQNIFQKT